MSSGLLQCSQCIRTGSRICKLTLDACRTILKIISCSSASFITVQHISTVNNPCPQPAAQIWHEFTQLPALEHLHITGMTSDFPTNQNLLAGKFIHSTFTTLWSWPSHRGFQGCLSHSSSTSFCSQPNWQSFMCDGGASSAIRILLLCCLELCNITITGVGTHLLHVSPFNNPDGLSFVLCLHRKTGLLLPTCTCISPTCPCTLQHYPLCISHAKSLFTLSPHHPSATTGSCQPLTLPTGTQASCSNFTSKRTWHWHIHPLILFHFQF